MATFAGRIRAFALMMGPPGLFLVAFLDSSFLSLPEIADFLVIYMVTHHKSQMVLYAASATLGSVSGCLVLYFIGKKGGDALLRKRFSTAHIDRTMAAFQRHGVMAVLIPSLLPPPMPFKIFVLMAGVAHIDVRRFIATLAFGRGLRYFTLGLLAVRYGDRALGYARENVTLVSLVAAGLLIGVFSAFLLWRRFGRRAGRTQ